MRIISAYAAWTRRQASACNCGHVAVLGAALLAVAVVALAHAGPALAVAAALVFTACAAAAAVFAWLRLRPRRAARCHDCGAAADGVVQFANGVRGDEVALCTPCFTAAEALARAAQLRTDHYLPRDLPAPAWPGPDWSPAAARLPAAADNAAPVDPVTAAGLAAVLARAQVRP